MWFDQRPSNGLMDVWKGRFLLVLWLVSESQPHPEQPSDPPLNRSSSVMVKHEPQYKT
jgi:hypothetical protein